LDRSKSKCCFQLCAAPGSLRAKPVVFIYLLFTACFVDSLHWLLRMHCDHEPTPNPSQEGNFRRAHECLLPSWEGSGVGRFMQRLLSLWRTLWDHAPPGILRPRLWSQTQPQRVGTFKSAAAGGSHTASSSGHNSLKRSGVTSLHSTFFLSEENLGAGDCCVPKCRMQRCDPNLHCSGTRRLGVLARRLMG